MTLHPYRLHDDKLLCKKTTNFNTLMGIFVKHFDWQASILLYQNSASKWYNQGSYLVPWCTSLHKFLVYKLDTCVEENGYFVTQDCKTSGALIGDICQFWLGGIHCARKQRIWTCRRTTLWKIVGCKLAYLCTKISRLWVTTRAINGCVHGWVWVNFWSTVGTPVWKKIETLWHNLAKLPVHFFVWWYTVRM